MAYGQSPSEWTGQMALILECLEVENYSPFFEEKTEMARLSNLHAAKKVRYRVMLGKQVVLANHLCFIEAKDDEFIDWQISFTGNETDFAYL